MVLFGFGGGEGLADGVQAVNVDSLHLAIVLTEGVVLVLGDLDWLEQTGHATIRQDDIFASVDYFVLFVIHGWWEL